MIKTSLYNKIQLQVEEAKEFGLTKLAEQASIIESKDISFAELDNTIDENLWKIASNIINYSNANSVDIVKLFECF